MTKPRVACTPLAQWPDLDRATWQGSAAVQAWPRYYAHRIAQGYGRLLACVGGQAPGRQAIEALEETLGGAHPPSSVASYLLELFYALAILRPQDDWGWLRQRCRDLRPKKSRVAGEKPVRIPPLCVPFDGWSEDQRTRWTSAFTRGSRRERYPTRKERKAQTTDKPADDQLDTRSALPPYLWTPAYRRRIERGWGMWLGWSRTGNDGNEWPTPESLSRFVGDCEARCNSTVTMASYVWEIRRAAETLWPDEDWRWLKDDANVLEVEAEPERDKWQQFAPIDEICRLGVTLMIEAMDAPATVQNAVKFRNGYSISFIALRPKRSRNIAECRVGEHLVLDANGVPIQLHWRTTKNGEPSTVPYPAALAKFHRIWWNRFRPILLGSQPDTGSLWIGHTGAPLSAGQIYKQLRLLTEERLGVAIGTHALRTAYATSFAELDARLLPLVQVMLDHRRPTSMAPYQLIGKQFSAARTLEGLQRPAIENAIARLRRERANSGQSILPAR